MDGVRFQAVIGSSTRLRDEALVGLRTRWNGPVQTVTEPEDLDTLLYGLDAPPLFGEPALVILRADEKWIRSRQEAFTLQIGRPLMAGGMILVAPALDQRWAFTKALIKAKVLIEAGPPDAKAVSGWLQSRIAAHPQGAQDPRSLADLLVDRVGTDADTLLCALDVVALHAGDSALAVADGMAVLQGVGQRPIWDVTGAILGGEAGKALELLQAGDLEPEGVLAALVSELRRLIACSESQDDTEVGRWTGARGNLFYARRRAQELGRKNLLRLMNGVIQLQRRLRTGGMDPARELEAFVLHARWVVKGHLRANPVGPPGRSR
jgi:DNA polymerase III delta subunit